MYYYVTQKYYIREYSIKTNQRTKDNRLEWEEKRSSASRGELGSARPVCDTAEHNLLTRRWGHHLLSRLKPHVIHRPLHIYPTPPVPSCPHTTPHAPFLSLKFSQGWDSQSNCRHRTFWPDWKGGNYCGDYSNTEQKLVSNVC